MTTPVTVAPVSIEVVSRTDVGRRREHNEDAFLVADLAAAQPAQPVTEERERLAWPLRTVGSRGALFVVADGMGGAAAGELASGMACAVILEEVRAQWAETPATDPDRFAQTLRLATERANQRIHAHATTHPDTKGMGTTVTLAGLLGDTLYLCQVGDSRAYLIRRGIATQITKDQSLMQRLVDAGELTAEEAEVSERRNIILQALGPEARVKVDLTVQRVQRGDLLVVCSDGLSGQVRGPEIAQLLGAAPTLHAGCDALIDRANATGGPDNITAIVVRLDGAGLPPTLAEVPRYQVYAGPPQDRATVPIDAKAIAASVASAEAAAPVVPPPKVPARPSSGAAPAAAPASSAKPDAPKKKRAAASQPPSLAPSLTVFAILVLIFVALGIVLS
ncbi:MAG: PP2C family protein-serine/threonine phosphatase [Gemmatimonadaceae bacterium]